MLTIIVMYTIKMLRLFLQMEKKLCPHLTETCQ